MKRTLLLVAALALIVVSVPRLPAALAASTETFRDEFNSQSWAGNDGSRDFLGPWTKSPGAQHVELVGNCPATKCLKLGEKDTVLTPQGISRGADLSGATNATITFQYRRLVTSPSTAGIELRAGPTAATAFQLWTIAFDETDPSFGTASFSLDPYVSPTTHIMFRGWGAGGIDGQIFIDNVEISAEFGNPPIFITDLEDRTDDENDVVALVAAATDLDGDPLSYSATELPPGVSIDQATGAISGRIDYSAAAGSPYAVTVTVSDGSATDTDTFTWTVDDRNRAPSITPIADQSTAEGSAWSKTVSASDPDVQYGDELRYSLVEAPAGMTIGATSGVLSWTPSELDGPGDHSVVVRVVDSAEDQKKDEESFELTVTEVNQPPVLTSLADRLSGAGDTASIQLTASDPDLPANELSFSATGLPPGLRVADDRISGSIGDAPGVYDVTVTVRDDGSPQKSDSISFAWTVTSSNRAPVIEPIATPVLGSDGWVRFTATATDPDGDKVSYSLSAAAPQGASINSNQGTFRWKPTTAQRGATYQFSVIATDDGVPNLSASRLVTVVVPEENVAPQVVTPNDQISLEGASVSLRIEAHDPNDPPDRLSYAALGLPPGLSIGATSGLISGVISYSAAAGSPYDVTVEVTDDGVPARTTSVDITWRVTNVNRPPVVAGPGSIIVRIDTTATIPLTISDPDGDPLSIQTVGTNSLGTVQVQSSSLRYTAGSEPGSETIRIRVDDGAAFAALTIDVQVVSDNSPPTAVADAFETFVDETLIIDSPGVLDNDADPDGNQLTTQLVTTATVGELELNADGSFVFDPPPGYVGRVEFEYQVSDGLETANATVRIRVRVRAGIIDPADRSGLIARRSTPEPVEMAGSARSAIVSRSFIALARSTSIQVDMLGVPLALLAGLALIAMTIGRFGSAPLLYSRLRTGTLASLHPDGFGHVEGDDGKEYFVSVESFRDGSVDVGDRIRFRSISATPRDLAVVVRPTA